MSLPDELDLKGFRGVCRLFPLPGVVLFPHVVLPLHIFEPRYRQMTEDALATDGLVTIVQVRSSLAAGVSGEPILEEYGCLGRILQHERLPDGRYNFLLHGRKRIRLGRELDVGTLYRQAEAEILEDQDVSFEDDSRRKELVGLFREILDRSNATDPDLERLLCSETSLGVLTDLTAHALGIPAVRKQALLAECSVLRRVEAVMQFLREILGYSGEVRKRPAYPPPFSPN